MRRGLNQLSGRTSKIRRRRIRRSRPTKTPSPLKSCQQTLKARPGLTPVTCPSPSPPSPRSSPSDVPAPMGILRRLSEDQQNGGFRICRQKPMRHFIPHRRALLRRLSPKTLRCDSTARSPLSDQPVDMPICVVHLRQRPCQPMTMSICAQLNKPGAFSWLSKNRSRQAEGRRHP